MAIPIFAGMLFQTLYYLVDLYFVAKLGGDAVAGVSAAGNLQFIVMALTQVLSVGTMVLISHAAGRKDPDDANLIFHQSLLMAGVCVLITLGGGFLLAARRRAAYGLLSRLQGLLAARSNRRAWLCVCPPRPPE